MSDLNYTTTHEALTTAPVVVLPAGTGSKYVRIHCSASTYLYFGDPADQTTTNSFLVLSSQDFTLPSGLITQLCARTVAGTGTFYALYA